MEMRTIESRKLQKLSALLLLLLLFYQIPAKFRGKTIEILGILSNSCGLTTREISDQTGIPVRIIGVYCRNGEK